MNALLENNQEMDDLEPNSHHHGHANKNKKKKKHSAPVETEDKGDVVIVEFNLETSKFLNWSVKGYQSTKVCSFERFNKGNKP